MKLIAAVLVALLGLPTVSNANKLTLIWEHQTSTVGKECGFILWRRSTKQAEWAYLAHINAGVKRYVDNGLDPTETYCYKVAAFNSKGTSMFTEAKTCEKPIAPDDPSPLPILIPDPFVAPCVGFGPTIQ